MRRMTVGMVTMARRKTRFPTDIGSNPTEAKPTASVTAFCVYLTPLQHQRMEDYNHSVPPNRPTPPYHIYRTHISAHIGALKSLRPSWCSTHHKQLFFYRREPDFFYGHRPLFEPRGDAVVMRRMTVGMVTMARRKTRFPTDIGSTPTEAKPTASVTAFCVYLIPLQHQRVGSDMHGDTPNRPTPP